MLLTQKIERTACFGGLSIGQLMIPHCGKNAAHREAMNLANRANMIEKFRSIFNEKCAVKDGGYSTVCVVERICRNFAAKKLARAD